MIGLQIRKYREKNGISQQKLAEAINVSQQTVNKWENGYAFPQADRLEEIAAVLCCPVSFLVYDDDKELRHLVFIDKTSEWAEQQKKLQMKDSLSLVDQLDLLYLNNALSRKRCGYTILFTDREYESLKGLQDLTPQISAELLNTIKE